MIEYDSRTALVVVDVQNDFAHPDGTIYIPEAAQVVPRVNEEIERALAADASVLYTQDWHPPETPHFDGDDGSNGTHCVRETWGAEFHPDLRVVGESVHKGVYTEHGYSGFTTIDPESGEERLTPLRQMLLDRGAERVVVVGLAYEGCVKATALDAARLGFETVVLRDASGSMGGERAEEAKVELTEAGATVL